MTPKDIERFWAKVEKTPGCWLWTGRTSPEGYGRFSLGKRGDGLAHRIAFELVHGPLLPGIKVLHSCDTPPCVRDDHLFAGTQKDNVLDAVQKGRHSSVVGRHWSTRKTHCKAGHPFDAVNTHVRPNGGRTCRTCRRKRKRHKAVRKEG